MAFDNLRPRRTYRIPWALVVMTLLLYAGCKSPVAGPIDPASIVYEAFPLPAGEGPETYAGKATRRYDHTAYLPDTNQLELLPVRYVRLNFHILNTTDTLYDFHGERALTYVRNLVHVTNEKVRENPKNWLNPDSMDVPRLPVHLVFLLARDPATGAPAVYEHYDDELYWYLHKGRRRNRSSLEVIRKYAVRTDRELNIFFQGPPRDSLKSPTFRGSSASGIYLGDAIKVVDILSKDTPPWKIQPVFTHEIGHALGLGHAWMNDGCPDTPTHPNKSWSAPKRGPGLTSNNLMDYGPDQDALTPCQIGEMHARLSAPGTRIRGWVREDWCTYRPDKPIVIDRDVTLAGARDFASDIVVRPGASLTLQARLHLPEGARIRVAPTARLILESGAYLHNDCGDQWGGIEIGRAPDGRAGLVEITDGARVLNVAE